MNTIRDQYIYPGASGKDLEINSRRGCLYLYSKRVSVDDIESVDYERVDGDDIYHKTYWIARIEDSDDIKHEFFFTDQSLFEETQKAINDACHINKQRLTIRQQREREKKLEEINKRAAEKNEKFLNWLIIIVVLVIIVGAILGLIHLFNDILPGYRSRAWQRHL